MVGTQRPIVFMNIQTVTCVLLHESGHFWWICNRPLYQQSHKSSMQITKVTGQKPYVRVLWDPSCTAKVKPKELYSLSVHQVNKTGCCLVMELFQFLQLSEVQSLGTLTTQTTKKAINRIASYETGCSLVSTFVYTYATSAQKQITKNTNKPTTPCEI